MCDVTCIYRAVVDEERRAQGVLLIGGASISQRRLQRHNFRGGTLSGKSGGGEFVGCLTAHPSSRRVNVNRQGEGLSCGGESIITEKGPNLTEFPE